MATPLNIETWKIQYSEEIKMVWDSMQTLMCDVMVVRGDMQEPKMIDHACTFKDFIAFCYAEPTGYTSRSVTLEIEEKLFHIWRNLRRIITANGLHDKMMRGATFYHFCKFVMGLEL
jgi:hypothetical protein